MDHARRLTRLLTLSWLVLAALWCLPGVAATEAGLAPLVRAIEGGWQYRWGAAPSRDWSPASSPDDDWRPLGALREPRDRAGHDELWLRVRLPRAAWSNQWLFIHEMNHVFTVTAGDEEVYRYGRMEPGRPIVAPGWRWHMIPVPERHAGKAFVIHARSDDVGYIGPFGYVGLGTRQEHLVRMVRRDVDRLVVATLSAFIGLLACVVYFGKRRAGEYVYFALFALVASAYVFCRTEIKTLLWDAPGVWMRLEVATLACLPGLFALHARGILLDRFRRWLTAIGGLVLLFAATAAVLDALAWLPLYNALHVILFELLLVAGLLLWMTAMSVRSGLTEAKLMIGGVLLAAVVVLQSSLASLKLVPWYLHLGHWAILILGLSFGVILLRRFILTYFEVERTLKDREARLSAILNALPDSFLLTNRSGGVAECRVTPETREALALHLPLAPTVRDAFPECIAAPLLESGRDEAVVVQEAEVPSSPERQWFELRTVPVDEAHRLTLIRNITERKKLDRMSREFVAMVSHELRTPLTVIKGTLALLIGERHALSPALAELVVNAKENADRLARLVNDLLDSQKIEAGHFAVHPAPLDVSDVVVRALALNRPFADRHQVMLRLVGAPPALTIHADMDRLIQALTNLLTNAVQFSPQGGVVSLRTEVLPGYVRFAVVDRGPGVPEPFQERLFQKFAQADSSDTRSRGGSGLGLSITKAIADRHGGSVGFESVPGEGTTFYLDLPIGHPESRGA